MLEKFDLFSHLTPKQLQSLSHISINRTFEPGEIIFYEGENSSYFHLLLKGEVSVLKTSAGSGPILVHRFHAPSLIAEVATLKQIPYPASAECAAAAEILKIEREAFLKLLHEDPALSISLIASLTQKIGVLELSLKRHGAPNAMAKVAQLIRDEPDIFKHRKGIEIAQMVGITPETLSRMIKKLKTEGIIAGNGLKSFTLINLQGLENYCG
jgi:CRP/FNR family transcriptional regulator